MYRIKEAAQRTGVSVALLRAWERRYGIVAPRRTEKGYRIYDDAAIGRIRAMRTLVADGWSPRQAAANIVATQAKEFPLAAVATQPVDLRQPTEEASGLVEAAARIDGPAIERALDDIFVMGSFERMVENHLYPALVALGDAWARGEVDVAGEHAASAAALRRLGMAFDAAGSAGAGDASVLVGLPPGSRHELPALGFATALRRAGVSPTYLGPDVPIRSWVTAVRQAHVRVAVIGVMTAEDVAGAAAVITALRDRQPDVLIAVGGRHGRELSDASAHLPDPLVDAVEALQRLLQLS
ncbi:MAG: MerR family transcriptional regulator [Chloroflexota bacterium]